MRPTTALSSLPSRRRHVRRAGIALVVALGLAASTAGVAAGQTPPGTDAPPTTAPTTTTTTTTTTAPTTTTGPDASTSSTQAPAAEHGDGGGSHATAGDAFPDGLDPATAQAATALTNAVQSTSVLQAALRRLDGEIIVANRELTLRSDAADRAARSLRAAAVARDEAADTLRKVAVAQYMDGNRGGLQRIAEVLSGADTSRSERTEALQQATVDLVQRRYKSSDKAVAAARKAKAAADRELTKAQHDRDEVVTERERTETALATSQGSIDTLRGQVNLGALVQANGGSIGGVLASREAGQLPPPIGPRFSWPLAVMRRSSPFGFRTDPVTGATAFHAGVDFPQPTGTPIRAAADGTVVIAGPEAGYGNCTVIDHGEALGTLYGHQSAIIVRPGDHVLRGQVIGYVGSTGKSTGPHLHFEVRVLGKPVNPLPWLDPAVG